MFRIQGFIFRKKIVWYHVFYIHRYKQSCRQQSVFDNSTYKFAYADAGKTHYITLVYTIVFLKMNPRVRNM